MNKNLSYGAWPELPYDEFAPTAYLLHMATQAIGKLKLLTYFEPHWANVPLWVTSRGLTTGLIPYGNAAFSVELDLISHQIICLTSWGQAGSFALQPMSVANLSALLFKTLNNLGIDIKINTKPQEIPNPIAFEDDLQLRPYEAPLANAWFRILISSHRVLQSFHARFLGITPPIGLMWGTFDLRDARYQGDILDTQGIDFIRRNGMDDYQIESGWWHGSLAYPKPAYFSFAYPKPEGIEKVVIQPEASHWDNSLGEYILDYDDVRTAKNPESDLLEFFNSAYLAGAKRMGWDPKLVGEGRPI